MTIDPSFPHQLTRYTKLLHKVALRYDEQVLILKRANEAKSRPSCWDLSGGNSEWPSYLSESQVDPHKQDIVREIKEETGLSISLHNFNFKDLIYFSTYFQHQRKIFTVIVGWVHKLASKPQIELSKEHQDYKWIKKSEIKNFDFGGKKGEFIVNIINNSFS